MVFEIKKVKSKFFIYLNSKKVLTPNKTPLNTNSEKHAKILIRDIQNKKEKVDPYSILNLSLFSQNLSKMDKIEISKKLLKIFQNDYILFRKFDDELIVKEMDKKFNLLIEEFSLQFNTSLKVQSTLINKTENTNEDLIKWIINLNSDVITSLFKLSNISDSLILSYFFIKKKIRCKRFFKLVNIESDYQQKRWGLLEEHNKSNNYFLNAIQNIDLFLKITNNK